MRSRFRYQYVDNKYIEEEINRDSYALYRNMVYLENSDDIQEKVMIRTNLNRMLKRRMKKNNKN